VIKGLEFILVELIKFKSKKWGDRKLAVLWLRFLKEVNEGMTKLPAELAENEHIRQAAELCEEGAFTPAELEAYDAYWDWVRTEKTLREGSRKEGEAIGLEKGEAIGLKKGEAERAQLKTKLDEAQSKLKDIVFNSYQAGLSVETIATITGLSIDEINIILKEY
jgi:hypothetical protein